MAEIAERQLRLGIRCLACLQKEARLRTHTLTSLCNQAVLSKQGVLVPSHVGKNLRCRAVKLKQVRHVEVDRHELTISTVVLRRIKDSCHPVIGINFCERHSPKDHSSRAD